MKALAYDALALFSLDVLKLGPRLEGMDNASDKTSMILFTFMSDFARIFIVFLVVMVFV